MIGEGPETTELAVRWLLLEGQELADSCLTGTPR